MDATPRQPEIFTLSFAISKEEIPDIVRSQDERGAAFWRLLADQGFTGIYHDLLQMALAKHARHTLERWVRTGWIFVELERVKRPVPRRKIPDQDREELVSDAVSDGLRLFHRLAVAGRGWTPDGRASMGTYFVGTCKFTFHDAYRQWFRCHGGAEVPDDFLAFVPDLRHDPARQAELRELIRTIINDKDGAQASILKWKMQGYLNHEIASLLGISVDAAESRIRRSIARIRNGGK